MLALVGAVLRRLAGAAPMMFASFTGTLAAGPSSASGFAGQESLTRTRAALAVVMGPQMVWVELCAYDALALRLAGCRPG